MTARARIGIKRRPKTVVLSALDGFHLLKPGQAVLEIGVLGGGESGYEIPCAGRPVPGPGSFAPFWPCTTKQTPAKKSSRTNCAESACVSNCCHHSQLRFPDCPAEFQIFFHSNFPLEVSGLGICELLSRLGSRNLVEPTSRIGVRNRSVVHQNVLHSAVDPSSAQARTNRIYSLKQKEIHAKQIRLSLPLCLTCRGRR